MSGAPRSPSEASVAPGVPAGWSAPSELTTSDGPALLALCAAALPDESLTLDDLEAVVFPVDPVDRVDRPAAPMIVAAVDAATLACRGEDGVPIGAVSVSLTDVLGVRSAHLQLLVVHPGRRRRGVARSLVDAAEAWAVARGSATLTVGAGAPFYLYTGVDTRWTEALCCFEALGYERSGTELDLTCPTVPPRRSPRRGGAPGIELSHVADERGAAELGRWVTAHYPHWAAEFDRAATAGTVVVARADDDGSLVGAAAHSVSRGGVVGPVAVSPDRQGGGVGARLMAEVLADLATAGLRTAEIAWTSTVRFYARACDARVGRTSVVLRRELGG